MNKKAFTLVELLAVIVILAMLTTLTGTVIANITGDSKNKLSNTQKDLIKASAKVWAADNVDRLPLVDNCAYVTISELVGTGYLDMDVRDPKTGELLSDDYSVKICAAKSSHGNIVYSYTINE